MLRKPKSRKKKEKEERMDGRRMDEGGGSFLHIVLFHSLIPSHPNHFFLHSSIHRKKEVLYISSAEKNLLLLFLIIRKSFIHLPISLSFLLPEPLPRNHQSFPIPSHPLWTRWESEFIIIIIIIIRSSGTHEFSISLFELLIHFSSPSRGSE